MSVTETPPAPTVQAEDSTPECPNGHGRMVQREHADPLAAWCGTWFDCRPGPVGETCWSSVLVPSAALLAQHAASGAAVASTVETLARLAADHGVPPDTADGTWDPYWSALDAVRDVLEAATDRGVTPSYVGRRVGVDTATARRLLGLMVTRHGYAHTSGNGAWTRWHTGAPRPAHWWTEGAR